MFKIKRILSTIVLLTIIFIFLNIIEKHEAIEIVETSKRQASAASFPHSKTGLKPNVKGSVESGTFLQQITEEKENQRQDKSPGFFKYVFGISAFLEDEANLMQIIQNLDQQLSNQIKIIVVMESDEPGLSFSKLQIRFHNLMDSDKLVLLYPQVDYATMFENHPNASEKEFKQWKAIRDISFILSESSTVADYYVHLSPFIVPKVDEFVKSLDDWVSSNSNNNWVILDLLNENDDNKHQGLEGKLLSTKDADKLSQYLAQCYDQYPLPKLIENFIESTNRQKIQFPLLEWKNK